MKFGMLHLFENPAGRTEREIVHEQLTLMRAAETYGFDSVWPAEHHFSEYGYCASPVPANSGGDVVHGERADSLDRTDCRAYDLMQLRKRRGVP